MLGIASLLTFSYPGRYLVLDSLIMKKDTHMQIYIHTHTYIHMYIYMYTYTYMYRY